MLVVVSVLESDGDRGHCLADAKGEHFFLIYLYVLCHSAILWQLKGKKKKIFFLTICCFNAKAGQHLSKLLLPVLR